jgi:hypothetical protein
MDEIANIKIYKEDGKYSLDFILYDEAAEKTGYREGLWVDKRISKEKLDDLLNVIKKRSNS